MRVTVNLERADQALRRADPVPAESLAGVEESPVARQALTRILSEPPARATPRRRQLAGLTRRTAGVVGAGALVALMAGLLLFVRGGDGPQTASVTPPAIHYAIFDRAQTTDEASILDGQFPTESIVPDTVRLADTEAGNRYILAKTSSGAICLSVQGRRGGGSSGCGGPGQPHVSLAGGEAVDNAHIVYGLVPDAIVEVSVNGRVLPVVGNVFHASLDPLTRRAVIDYRTSDGVVTAWRESIPVEIGGSLPPVRVEPFGAQARAMQTRMPYLGVSCPKANSFACDRVGLTVWLRKPALEVVAKIAGRRVVLDDPRWSGPLKDGRRKRFAGFLQPAGLIDGPLRIPTKDGGTRWTGDPAVTAKVLIIVTYRAGSASTAVMRVPLSPGWG